MFLKLFYKIEKEHYLTHLPTKIILTGKLDEHTTQKKIPQVSFPDECRC